MSLLKNLSMTSGVFLVVFVLSLVSAQNDDLELSPQSDFGQLDEIQELLQKVQALYEEKIASNVQQGAVPDEQGEEKDMKVDGEINAQQKTYGCGCAGLTCTCCKQICVRKLGINQNYCVSLTYVRATGAVCVTLKAGWQVIISKQISAKYPQQICVPIKCSMRGVTACLQFYNFRVTRCFTGCSRLVVRCPGGWVVANVIMGCFRIPLLDAPEQQVEGQQSPVMDPEPIYRDEIPMEKLSPAGDKYGKM